MTWCGVSVPRLVVAHWPERSNQRMVLRLQHMALVQMESVVLISTELTVVAVVAVHLPW